MDVSKRVVTEIPMAAIWLEDSTLITEERSNCSADQINESLRFRPIRFVVAEVGKPLRWIPLNTCFDFWKEEAEQYVHSLSDGGVSGFHAPYFFIARMWKDCLWTIAGPIILLEKVYLRENE